MNHKQRFYVAHSYIEVCQNLIDEMLKNYNPRVVVSDHEIDESQVAERLRYSSPSVILPALFCLYQGIELLLKGFVLIKAHQKARHNAEELVQSFSKYYPEEEVLSVLFKQFVLQPPCFIKQYIELNRIKDISSFYNSLRYPDNNNSGEMYDYDSLMYLDNRLFIPQIKKVKDKIDSLLILSVRLFRKLEDQGLLNPQNEI